MRTRVVVWGVVVALAAVAAGLVVIAGGGDGDGGDTAAPRLPLDLAGAPGASNMEPAADGLAVGIAPTRYVAGDDLPAMGGEAPAYPVPVTADRVAALAEALGIDGEPREQDGSWRVEGNGLALDAYGPGGAWSAWPLTPGTGPDTPQSSPASPPAAGGDEAGNTGGGAPASTVVCVTTPCEPAPGGDAPATGTAEEPVLRPTEPQRVQECPADPGGDSCRPACRPGPAVTCPAGPAAPATTVAGTTPPAAPSIPQQEARDLAVRVLDATGFTPADVAVNATSAGGAWTLALQPTVDGHDAPGLTGSLVVGATGVQSASGYFAPGEALGDYPLLTTTGAIERLNAPGEVTAQAGAVASAESSAGASVESSAGASIESSARAPVEPAAPTTGTRPPLEAASATEPEPGPAPAPAPVPEPEPVEVVLDGVALAYTTVPSFDRTGAYVVPSYRFTALDGQEVVVNALADEALQRPPRD